MPRNKNVDYTKYIHEFTDDNGRTRYAVAEWDEEKAQYIAPLSKTDRELTGCFAEFAKKPKGLGGYLDKKRALRRARYLFGPQKEEEE
jgi:hypothetical protein